MRPILCFSLLLFLLSGCGYAPGRELASRGAINEDAPVKAVVQIVIDAPPSKVWTILADIKDWPKWQTDIIAVDIKKPPTDGVVFDWSTDGGHISSRLALYVPQRQLSWTGHLLIFQAIHVWTLSPLTGGRTLVQTKESMSGWPLGWLYSSHDLVEADQRWLVDLKKQAESART
jgi:uncharacterized protein YndB with AHSA1/START domain